MRAIKFLQLVEGNHHNVPSHKQKPKASVLIVDDMAINRTLLQKVLSQEGYDTMDADSSQAALGILQSGEVPAVIISDVEMPGEDGIAMTSKIRAMGGDFGRVPIILSSGNPDEGMEMECYGAGGDVFMKKPFDLDKLRSQLADLVKPALRNQPEADAEPQKRSFFGKKTKPEQGPPNEFNTKI